MNKENMSERNIVKKAEGPGKSMIFEKCLLKNTVVNIPQIMCDEEEIFEEVINLETWEKVLSENQRQILKKYLPNFSDDPDGEEEQNEAIRSLFNRENIKFGNPLIHFYKKLQDGFFAPGVAKTNALLRKASYREYKYQQRHYYYRLLKDVLISRKKLLDASVTLPPDQPVRMQLFTPKPRDTTISEITRLRYFSELQEVREECVEFDTSSEDENYPESIPPKFTRKHKKQMQTLEASLSPDVMRVTSTIAPPPGFQDGGVCALSRSLCVFEMSEERYREMLLRYKRKLAEGEDLPELDFTNITLEDIIARTNLAKRPLSKPEAPIKKKVKHHDVAEKKIKIASPNHEHQVSEPNTSPSQPVKTQVQVIAEEPLIIPTIHPVLIPTIKEEIPDEVDIDVGSDGECNPPRPPTPCESHTQVSCFFSLMRDSFCETTEQRLSAVKLEEKVRIWLEDHTSQHCEWINQQENWIDLASSAIKFLAGDLISILPENFVPYLDYKKKQQQWQWIGTGRDSDEQLNTLCQHWLENKDDVSLDVLETSQGSPPPPRMITDWTVRPTTDEEKLLYREQECVRYQKPHKAFTFHIHGYDSVVGPVKGVYGKESGVNKAREHSLLVSDRPPFVTILSLVRDAAARLPNGEGTRADICELLKDSQYLALASDQQIHTVVSGALDRLHYEKDPCVKYDVNRKLWIYLHRNRTEEEFERIHQAQAAAAKAKKAIQKTKMPRVQKSKDPVTISQVPVLSSSAGENALSGMNLDIQSKNHSRQLVRSFSLPIQNTSKVTNPVESHAKRHLSSTTATPLLPSGTTTPATLVITPTSTSPKHVSNLTSLPQAQNGGNNSRPNSQGSVQSLPSPKTVIANVNAAQFVGVTPLSCGTSIDQSLPSPSSSPTPPPPITIDMKPLSPAFVGQPPVLQPVISQPTLNICSTLASNIPPVVTHSLGKAVAQTASIRPSLTVAQALSSPTSVQGFQTIVIKPDGAGGKPGTAISTLPLLATGNLVTTSKTSPITSNPVVARVMAGTQVVSLSNLVAGAASQSGKQGPAGTATFRIQGGNFVQPVTASPLNVLQAQLTPAAAAKLPRLAVVTQPNVMVTSASATTNTITTAHPKLITVSQGQLGVLQAAHLDSTVSHDSPVALTAEAKAVILSTHRTLKTLNSVAVTGCSTLTDSQSVCKQTPTMVVTTKSAQSTNSLAMPNATIPSVILASGSPVSSPAVVIATQGALKPTTQTYVMAAPGSSPAVVMAAAQQGMRAVTPVNVKTLQGIKVIPVSSVSTGKSPRTQPLLARILAPPTGVTLQPAGAVATVSAGLGQAQVAAQPTAVGIVQGLSAISSQLASRSAVKPTTLPLATTSSQPVIVQVQTSAVRTSENIGQSKEG